MKIRHSSLFDMDSIAPLGSKAWAEESRKAIQDALDSSVDGKIRFTEAMRYFWKQKGWEVLEDQHGKRFKSLRRFALAERPHGLHMTPDLFRAFMKEIGKEMEAIGEYAAENPLPPKGRPKDKKDKRDIIPFKDNRGTSAEHLARRIARDRPDILERLKAGEYKSVHAAAKDAGIVRDPTPLELAQKAWRKADAAEQDRIIQWFLGEIEQRGSHGQQP